MQPHRFVGALEQPTPGAASPRLWRRAHATLPRADWGAGRGQSAVAHGPPALARAYAPTHIPHPQPHPGQGKLAVAHGKVNMKNVADDVIDLAQALVKPGVSLRNKIGADTPQVGATDAAGPP